MEDNVKLVESLLEKAGDFGKTSLELIKLKALDKTSEIVSSMLPQVAMYALLAAFMFFSIWDLLSGLEKSWAELFSAFCWLPFFMELPAWFFSCSSINGLKS